MAIVDGYATLEEVKAELRLGTLVDDARIEQCIEAASRNVDDFTHRTFVAGAVGIRVYRSDGRHVFVDPCDTPTLVEASNDQATWSPVTAYVPVVSAGAKVRWLESTAGLWATWVRVTAPFGEALLPQVKRATILESIRLFVRSNSPEGVLVGDWGAARMARIDADYLALLRPLRRQVLG